MRITPVACLLLIGLVLPACGVSIGSGRRTRTTLVTNMKGDATRTVHHDLELAPGDTLVLKSSFGDIEVRTANRPPRVTAELRVRAYTQKEAETAVTAFKLDTKRTARGIEVVIAGDAGTYETGEGKKAPYKATASYTATVPEDVKVITETGRGENEVSGPLAGCHAVSRVGDIDIENVSGRVHAVVTKSGDIEADGAFVSLTAKTSTGDVEIRVRPGSRVDDTWRVETGVGDVTLYLPKGMAASVSAVAKSGDISTNLPFAGRAKSDGETRLTLKLGDGAGRIEILTASGDIDIRRN